VRAVLHYPFIELLIPWFQLHPWQIPFPLIGTLKLQPFGMLVAIGILFGQRVAEWRAENTGVPRQAILDFLLYTTIIGLIACYFLNALFYKPEDLVAILHDPTQLWKRYLGLSSYGGFIGGTGAALWFRHKRHMSLIVLGDLWCFAFPFAWAICRMGCFTVHDHPGLVTDFFLAVDNYNGEGLPRHDLGLYEVLWALVVAPLFWFLAKKPRKRGFFLALLPLLYAPIRFFLDFLRETAENGGDVRYFGLTPGQYASLFFLLVGIVLAFRVKSMPEAQLMLHGAPMPDDAPPAPELAKSKPPRKPRTR
jgi:phosphatidylglycerol:prolipoprotein diacylglycerol transferase